MKKLLYVFALLFCIQNAKSQEIKATVQCVAPRVQISDKQILTTLQNSIQQFITTRRWTEEKIETNEKIEISLFFDITAMSDNNEFQGTMQLQVIRPVLNSTYKTTVIQFNDEDVTFSYREFENLEFQENQNLNDLTSLLAYYVYISLGLDYDSFGELAGTPFYVKAQTIVNLMTNKTGWNQTDGKGFRNRFYLAENLNNVRFKDFRVLNYNYHRKGMDKFYQDPEMARKNVTESIKTFQESIKGNQNSLLQKVFFFTKWPELVEIYKGASVPDKTTAIKLLNELDATNGQRYEKIRG